MREIIDPDTYDGNLIPEPFVGSSKLSLELSQRDLARALLTFREACFSTARIARRVGAAHVADMYEGSAEEAMICSLMITACVDLTAHWNARQKEDTHGGNN